LADSLTVGLRCARRNDDPAAIGQVGALLGQALGHLGHREQSLEVGRLSIEACERANKPELLAGAYSSYGSALIAADRLEEATAVNREAVDVLRAVGELPQLASGLIDLGNLLIRRGLHAEGDSCLDEAVRHARKAGNAYILAFALNDLGFSQRAQHRDQEAVPLLTEAAALRGTIDDAAGRATSLLGLSSVLLRLGAHDARQSWTQASALADEIDYAEIRKLREEVASEFAAQQV
jgi:tetratricopeptide (TPR) repeat protein